MSTPEARHAEYSRVARTKRIKFIICTSFFSLHPKSRLFQASRGAKMAELQTNYFGKTLPNSKISFLQEVEHL